MGYLPTLDEKWPHSRGNVGKSSLHGASGHDKGSLLTNRNSILEITGLGGGFKHFLFSSLFGEDSHFD